MSLLGTINPNARRSQSVVSHNIPPTSHDDNSIQTLPGDEGQEKCEIETLQARVVRRESTVSQLAMQLKRHSTRFSEKDIVDNPFTINDPESTVNPHSPNFRVKNWLKMLLAVRNHDPERFPDRTAGVSFRNLSVHGFGSPTDYQKNVLNVLLEIGTIFRRLAGFKMPKIQIIRDFEGLVKSGEMLVVLGRPGSGCSTLLKTIAGEMNGIQMSDASVLNYQGMCLLVSLSLSTLIFTRHKLIELARHILETDAEKLQRRSHLFCRDGNPLSPALCW